MEEIYLYCHNCPVLYIRTKNIPEKCERCNGELEVIDFSKFKNLGHEQNPGFWDENKELILNCHKERHPIYSRKMSRYSSYGRKYCFICRYSYETEYA